MNDLPRIPIRIALRGGPAQGLPVECEVHESVFRQPFVTSALDVLMRAGLPITNAGPVVVDLIYKATGRYTLGRQLTPIFEFTGIDP
jgi:hypothetical protein